MHPAASAPAQARHNRSYKPSSSDQAGITTALVYTRVSSDEQAREGLSLPAQLDGCRHYAARQGWTIGTEYSDVMSGRRDDRPHYQAMLTEARRLREDGRPAIVVVMRLDRLGRRLLERVNRWQELKALGVAVHSVAEGGAVPDLVANMLAVMAQEESERLGARVRETWQHVESLGWHKVGHCPIGYRWREPTTEEKGAGAPAKVLDVDPIAAPIVQEAFRRVAAGESCRSVARWLGRQPQAALGGRTMSWRGVVILLRAAVYNARHQHGDANVLARPRTRWPALVDDATWTRVQEHIDGHRHIPNQATGAYLLTGFLRCPNCGQRMSGADRRRYLCQGRLRGAGAADPNCRFNAHSRIDGYVIAEVTDLLAPVAAPDQDLDAALYRAWEGLQAVERGGDVAARIHQLEQESARLQERLVRAAERFLDNDIDKEMYRRVADRAQAELEDIAAELARLRGTSQKPSLPPLELVLGQIGGWAAALRGTDVGEQREALRVLVQRVVPIRLGFAKYRVEIAWTPVGEALLRAVGILAQEAA